MKHQEEPSILTDNCFYWYPVSSASARLRNEEVRLDEVERYFEQLGFDVSRDNNNVEATHGPTTVVFTYSERCKSVYKSLRVQRGGKRSNIVWLRRYIADNIEQN